MCQRLSEVSANNPKIIANCKSGEDFEKCVVDAADYVITNHGIQAKIHYTPGSHVFPDVIIEYVDGAQYGIEAKSTSSATSKAWKINGNSVLGSTREDVIDTYIIFGKTSLNNQAFRFKRYEDSIANVAVTHSPRYVIDLDIDEKETFFAKSGLSYKQISESQDPIGMITSFFKSQGLQAWWLAESSPAAVRLFSDLHRNDQAEMIGYAFAHFPELLSNDHKKFNRCALWMVMERSVVSCSLRDNFTAGGKVTLCLNGKTYSGVPQIFSRMRDHKRFILSALDKATTEELHADWGSQIEIWENIASKVHAWIQMATKAISTDSIAGYPAADFLSDIFAE